MNMLDSALEIECFEQKQRNGDRFGGAAWKKRRGMLETHFFHFVMTRTDTYLQFKMAGALSPYGCQPRDSYGAIKKKGNRGEIIKGGPLSAATNRGAARSYRGST